MAGWRSRRRRPGVSAVRRTVCARRGRGRGRRCRAGSPRSPRAGPRPTRRGRLRTRGRRAYRSCTPGSAECVDSAALSRSTSRTAACSGSSASASTVATVAMLVEGRFLRQVREIAWQLDGPGIRSFDVRPAAAAEWTCRCRSRRSGRPAGRARRAGRRRRARGARHRSWTRPSRTRSARTGCAPTGRAPTGRLRMARWSWGWAWMEKWLTWLTPERVVGHPPGSWASGAGQDDVSDP